jgi:hypothetical protein
MKKNMMKVLGIQTRAVPHHGRVLAGRSVIAFLSVNEVVEFSGIPNEEDRSVVSPRSSSFSSSRPITIE